MSEIAFRVVRSPWGEEHQPVRVSGSSSGGFLEEPLCMDCRAPVAGRSWRCPECKSKARAVYTKRWRDGHPEAARRIEDQANLRARMDRELDPEAKRERDREYRRTNRDRINANRRRLMNDPKYRARVNAQKRQWAAEHPEAISRSMKKANLKRRQSGDQWSHDYQTKYVGDPLFCDPPTCRQCGVEVPYHGRGRPRVDCFTCRPLSSREKKSARTRALAESQQPGEPEC